MAELAPRNNSISLLALRAGIAHPANLRDANHAIRIPTLASSMPLGVLAVTELVCPLAVRNGAKVAIPASDELSLE